MDSKRIENELINTFKTQYVQSADCIVFRIILEVDCRVSDVAIVNARNVENLEITDEMLPLLAQLAERIKKKLIEEIGSGKRMPKLMILKCGESSSSRSYEYQNVNAFSISVCDIGKKFSYFNVDQMILPDLISAKRKQDACAGKVVESVWELSAAGHETSTIPCTDAGLEKLLGLFQRSASLTSSDMSPLTGLQLSLFKDGFYYDEAVNKSLNIDWINRYGEWNQCHTVCYG